MFFFSSVLSKHTHSVRLENAFLKQKLLTYNVSAFWMKLMRLNLVAERKKKHNNNGKNWIVKVDLLKLADEKEATHWRISEVNL